MTAEEKHKLCAECESNNNGRCAVSGDLPIDTLIAVSDRENPYTIWCCWHNLPIQPKLPTTNFRRLRKYAQANIAQKVISYAKALIGPKVSRSVYRERLAICRQCDRREVTDAGEFCRACGCGQRDAAKLTNKLRHAAVECPAGYFDKDESRGDEG